MLFYIWKSLWQDKLRFFLSILGVTLSIVLIAVIQGFMSGIYKQMATYPSNSGADFWIAQEGVDSLLLTYSIVPNSTKQNLLKISEVDKVNGIYYFPSIFINEDIKVPVNIIGYDTNNALGSPWSVVDGRYIKKFPLFRYLSSPFEKDSALLRKQLSEGEVIFDKALANIYGLKVGDQVEIMDMDFKIVGMTNKTASWVAAPLFVSREDAARLLEVPSNAFSNFILVKLKPGQNKDLIRQKIISRIPDIEVWKTETLIKNDKMLMKDLFLGPIAMMVFIAFIIGILIIGLTIYTTTLQKIREFGILKAIGAKNSQLYFIILIQTFIISFIGFILGIGASEYLHYFTNMQIDTKFMIVITRSNLIGIFVATIIMSLIASYLPARRVFYIDPSLVFKR